MQTITHTNPDGSTVNVMLGVCVRIGNRAVVCRETSVCKGVRIPERYTVPQNVVAIMPGQTVHVLPNDQEA